jgi:membrane protease YdiL (CAAX protease family)
MLQNFSRKFKEKKMWLGILLPLWVLAGFVLAQVLVTVSVELLSTAGVNFEGVNSAVLNTVAGGIIYAISLLLVIGLPWWIKKNRTSKEELGLSRGPKWVELLLAPAGFIVYILLSALLVFLAMQFLPFIDFEQVQDTGYSQLYQQFEFILALIMLVFIAPIAEEVLFRGYLLGKLRAHVPVWLAILLTSVLFAIVHGAWNVGIDVFALSIVLCLLRVVSGSLWPSIILHMMKNGLAFYLLFINPTLLGTLG